MSNTLLVRCPLGECDKTWLIDKTTLLLLFAKDDIGHVLREHIRSCPER